jgi:putative transposase
MREVHPESPGVSKSSVSRLWAKAGAKLVDELRTRDIASQTWLALMLDGIVLSKDQTAVVALGITSDGKKHILDFELGSSENYEICRDLVGRLVARDFAPEGKLLAVLDGSAALKKGVFQFFPDAIIQRCLIHKERNIQGRLSRRHWAENVRLFKRLREAQGEQAAREVLAELENFLASKNAAALASLQEAGDELIALHMLEVPSTLNRSLLSTNIIENSFRNTRRKIGRVTRFRAETDQAARWLAYALFTAEKGFNRIAGWKDLGHLVAALQRDTEAPPSGAASVGAGGGGAAAAPRPRPPPPPQPMLRPTVGPLYHAVGRRQDAQGPSSLRSC